MSQITVMHILCMNTYSGAENVAITLINSLKDKVHSVYVSPDGPITEIVRANGIEHYSIEKVDTKNIKKAIKDVKPDIIHAHDFTAGVVSSLVAGKIPIVNHLHNNSPWLKRAGVKSISYFLSCLKYKQILTVSNSVMDEFVFGNLVKKKSLVVGNPIDIATIRKKSTENGIIEKPSDIIFLGRLTPAKNPLLFIDIIANLLKILPSVKVAIVGDGELRNQVEQKILAGGLNNNIRIYGFQRNPYGLLRESKIMCMPSTWEGFGLAAVEGLALGKPVVAANVGGLPGIITSQCGLLCTKKEDYVCELQHLLVDSDYYAQKSHQALKQADKLDNLKNYTETIYLEYIKLCD